MGRSFVRDPSKVENLTATGDQFDLNGTGRANRLRLQAIMNGMSLNGTNIKLFQTLGGAETATGLGANYSSYNNTLGLAVTARINTGAATSARAPTITVGECFRCYNTCNWNTYELDLAAWRLANIT